MNKQIRGDFSFFSRKDPYVFLDSAATTQKPRQVIDRMSQFYAYGMAPVFRATYHAAEQATELYENTRAAVAQFINAQPNEIVFTSGTTDSINVVATSWAREHIVAGDEILITQLEHSSNVLVWQALVHEKKAKLVIVPITPDGELDMHAFAYLLSKKTKLVAVTHVSNAIGTHVDIAQIIKQAHAIGARVLLDAAQSVPHQRVDFKKLDVDFLAFSGHKMCGPTGIGVLFVRQELHDQLIPYRYGGGMVRELAIDGTSKWEPMPRLLEAGTPPIAQVIGLAAAIDYLTSAVNFDELVKYEAQLTAYAIEELKKIDRVRIIGPLEQLKKNGHLVSFVVDGVHAHDVAAFLDAQQPSVAVRAGQQCAQLVHAALQIPASVRLSFYLYTTIEEIDTCVKHIKKLVQY